MKIEFVLDKKDYQKLLTTDVKSDKIKYYSKKIKGKTNYILTLSTNSSSIDAAKLLSENRKALEKLFEDSEVKYRLLTEESSQFLLNELYPLACEFETKLRKFIYITLFDIDEKAEELVLKNYNATMGVSKGNKVDQLPKNEFLEKKELHEIFDFLFANDTFLMQARQLVETNKSDRRHKTKQELLVELNNINDTSLWQVIFKPVFPDCILPDIYKELQNYRNIIMHFHNICYTEYEIILETFKRGIEDLNCQIGKGIVIEDTENNVNSLANSNTYAKSLFNESQFINPLAFDSLGKLSMDYKSLLDPIAAQIYPWQQQVENWQSKMFPWQQQLEYLQSQINPLQQQWEDLQTELNPLRQGWGNLQLGILPSLEALDKDNKKTDKDSKDSNKDK